MERREFLKVAGAAGVAAIGVDVLAQSQQGLTRTRPKNSKSVAGLVVPKMNRVRVGLIGVGARGSGHLGDLMKLEGVDIVAICDNYAPFLERAVNRVVKAGMPTPKAYGRDSEDFKRMLGENKLDLVVIATPWRDHARMAIAAMNSGAHAAVEVPMCTTVEECWQMVETAERTQRNCMMLENVCYGREELLVLNMVQKGVFGTLLHGEASYIHDLRGQMHEIEHGTGSWRTLEYTMRNGNLYPTHGLGPVAQYMDINRGDAFDYMVSMGSPAVVRGEYAKKAFPEGHSRRSLKFICNDINTSIIKTKLGRTIMLQWDEQLPRPYSRHNLLQGSEGCWAGFPNRFGIAANGKSADSWQQGAELDFWYKKYDHPLYKVTSEAAKGGGHGGMDFVMWWRLIYCLRNAKPLDQDVYDGAAWSVVGPLSEKSLASKAKTMDIPDFTRGEWKTRKPLDNMSDYA